MMKHEEPVYLIILNHNNMDVISPLYRDLMRFNDYPKYLIFIDNGSSDKDGSKQFLREKCKNNPFNFLFELPHNLGTTKGWNLGLKYIFDYEPSAKYVGLVNSDMTLSENWLSRMMNVLKENKSAGMISNQLRDPENKTFIQNDGPDTQRPFHFRMGFSSDFAPYTQPLPVEWGHMGATIFKTEVFRKIGMFDENMFIYSSDFDIQIRLKLAGYEIWHCPTSVAYHRTFHTCTEVKKNPDIEKLCARDGQYLNTKWHPELMAKFRDNIRISDGNEKDIRRLYQKGTLEVNIEDITGYFGAAI